jgi:hypothetical protein
MFINGELRRKGKEAVATAKVGHLSSRFPEGAEENHENVTTIVGLQPGSEPGAPEYDFSGLNFSNLMRTKNICC